MAKGASARAAARRQKDKWKGKRWYSIRAPRNPWSFKVIGETIAAEEKTLLGRHYEVMQSELDGDFSKMHVKIRFRVSDVIGSDALTEFVGHDVMKDHVRRQIRRERGKIDDSIDIVTEDGYFIRLKPFIVTRGRIKGSQKQESRTIARNEIIKFCSRSTWISVQKALLDGSLEEEVRKAVSKIQPVRSAFFRRSQLIQSGVVIDEGPTLEEIIADEKGKEESGEDDTDVLVESDPEPISDDSPDSITLAAEEEVETELEERPKAHPTEGDSDLSKLSKTLKAEIVSIAKSRGLDSTGTKQEIVIRIYESLTVPELKTLLKEADKPVSGKKADLVARLAE
jgi:small subunit ribosomal protein S3Ae